MPEDTQPTDPLERSWTREELVDAANRWMRSQPPGEDRERYYARLGLLVDFVTDLFDRLEVDKPDKPWLVKTHLDV